MAEETPSSPHSALYERIATSFERQGMMQHLGAQLEHVSAGEVGLTMPYSERVTQQQGSFHGGAMGALADAAAGCAGLTVVEDGMEVVAIEYKINFLGTRSGGTLQAIGRVVKPGRRLIVTTAEVNHLGDDGKLTPCALMQQTLALVPKSH